VRAAQGAAPAALQAFERALGDHAEVALAAVESLGGLSGAFAERCAAALGRAEPEVVRAAVASLCRHAAHGALESVVPLVSHPDWSVRAEAIDALARRGVRRAAPAILRLLEAEGDPFVREAILRAMARLEA
jgi:HEAT repeat protein